MLWWLLGERSWDLGRPFGRIPAKCRPLVLAKELADFTSHPPGPASVSALLSRGGVKDRPKLSIAEAINTASVDWLATVVDDVQVSAIVHPIHLGIARKLETRDDESWIAGWSATAGLDSSLKIPPLQLGRLFYRERLLIAAAQLEE